MVSLTIPAILCQTLLLWSVSDETVRGEYWFFFRVGDSRLAYVSTEGQRFSPVWSLVKTCMDGQFDRKHFHNACTRKIVAHYEAIFFRFQAFEHMCADT